MTFVWEALELLKIASFLHFQITKEVVKKIDATPLHAYLLLW